MPSSPSDQPASQDEPRQRADPTFKRVTEKLVLAANADSKATELKNKQLTSPDLFVELPPGTNTRGTLLDFFRQYTIIEFKSRNDTFTAHKLLAHTGRVTIWQSEQLKIKPKQVLNVFVVSKLPPKLLGELARQWGYPFKRKRGRPGFYKTRVGSQDIVLVVCSELPLEPKYGAWLLFADPTTEKWREAVRMMADNQQLDLLEEAAGLYPREYKMMTTEIEERLAYLNPQEQEEYLDAVDDLAEDRLIRMQPARRLKVLSKLPTEERLKDVPTEERLKGLAAEEKKRLLKQLQQELGETE